MTTATDIRIRSEDNLFRHAALRAAMRGPDPDMPIQQRRAPELGPAYDDQSTPSVTVTTRFQDHGWYNVTNVTSANTDAEDRFWSNLSDTVREYPHWFRQA